MTLNIALGVLACLSVALSIWQWLAAQRFPLHQRVKDPAFAPAVTLLNSLNGCDPETANCLRSWFAQDYAGEIQILSGVTSPDDPVCAVVKKLMSEFPAREARWVVCGPLLGANARLRRSPNRRSSRNTICW